MPENVYVKGLMVVVQVKTKGEDTSKPRTYSRMKPFKNLSQPPLPFLRSLSEPQNMHASSYFIYYYQNDLWFSFEVIIFSVCWSQIQSEDHFPRTPPLIRKEFPTLTHTKHCPKQIYISSSYALDGRLKQKKKKKVLGPYFASIYP